MKSCPACNARYDDETTFCTRDGTPVVGDGATGQSMVGQIFDGKWRILKKLGEGGMGEVYVAKHIHIEKKVAMKLLRAEVVGNAEAVTRFYQEARSASSIGHENIIQIEDFGKLPDGRVYMLMEYLVGAPLNEMIAREPLPLSRALDVAIQVCRGLSAAHAKGITHRDMKPENVYVTQKDGRDLPKILDFGIAKVHTGDTAQNLTQAGTIYGTPFYMAPEQALGGKMDHRVDVYAMGVILYEVFCGTLPFKGETFMGILTQHITAQPEPPSAAAMAHGRQVPPELEQIILKAIRKSADERFQSMNEMAMALADVYRAYVGPRRTDILPSVPAHMMPTMGVGVGGTSGSMLAMSGSGSVPAMMPTMTPAGMPQYGGGTPAGMQVLPAMTPAGMPVYPQTTPPPSRKGLVVVAVVVACLGIGGGVGWYFLRPGVEPPKPEVRKDPEPEKKPEPVVAKDPEPEKKPDPVVAKEPEPEKKPDPVVVVKDPEPVKEPEKEPVKEPAKDPVKEPVKEPVRPRTHMVVFGSSPDGADIVVNGKILGTTPGAVPLPEGQKVQVELRLDGYRTKRLSIAPGKDKVTERLEKVEKVEKVVKPPSDDEELKTPEAFKKKDGS